MKRRIFRDVNGIGGWAILQPDKTLEFYDRKEMKIGTTQNWSHEPVKKILEGLKGAGFVKARYTH